MPQAWMVRAEGGEVVDDFARGFVALGGMELPDLEDAPSQEAVRDLYVRTYPADMAGKVAGAVAMLFKVRAAMRRGDTAIRELIDRYGADGFVRLIKTLS